MKKLTFKIRKGTKGLILGLGILGVLGLSYTHSQAAKKVMPKMALVGLVATMKKKKEGEEKSMWDTASEETKAFAQAQDEAYKGLLEKSELDQKLADFLKKSDLKNQLTDEEKLALKDMNEAYKAIGLKLKQLEDRGLKNEDGLSPIIAALKEGKDVRNQKHSFADFISKAVPTLELEVKSMASEAPTDVATHTIGDRIPGIGQLPVRKPLLLDLFPSSPTTKEYVRYMDQETVVRNAQNIYGTNTMTATTKVTWKERNIQIMKVKDLINVSSDMLADYDFVEGEVRQLIGSSVSLQADSQLLSGTGTSPECNSIDLYAGEFDAATASSGNYPAAAGTIEKANIFDLVLVMAGQISALGKANGFMPDTVLMNSYDVFINNLQKDSTGQYILPPFVTLANGEWTIHGMKVRANPLVTTNTLYVFDSTKGKILYRKGLTLEMAYNNGTDFEVDQVTIKGTMRLNFFVRNTDTNAFMKCSDVAAAIAAITKGASS